MRFVPRWRAPGSSRRNRTTTRRSSTSTTPALVDFLRTAHRDWVAAGYPDDPGQESVVSYIYPHPGLIAGVEPIEPVSRAARTGYHCFDTMTPIGPGTWEAARAAADAALTAVDLVVGGDRAAYACTRPPGHHVTRSAYGGSCYLNNAAIAAQGCGAGASSALRSSTWMRTTGTARRRSSGIAATSAPPRSTSIRKRAGSRTFSGSRGRPVPNGRGRGANLNLPLAPGTGDEGWLVAVEARDRVRSSARRARRRARRRRRRRRSATAR